MAAAPSHPASPDESLPGVPAGSPPVSPLVEALKKLLKARGMTYRQLALRMRLSEPSVKRLFSTGRFTLARIEEMLQILESDFLELARLAGAGRQAVGELSEAQEQALAADPILLGVAYLLLTGSTPARIRTQFEIGEVELVGALAQLDRLRIVDLMPGNRVRLRVARNMRWRPDGPLSRRYRAQAIGDLFASSFAQPLEKIRFLAGELTPASIGLLQKKLDLIAAEFSELMELDAGASPRERRNAGLVMAIRPWTFPVVAELRRR
ncbi:MAG: helix-turn-helix domain-containing protein [Burkholderiales bacterium]|nr:helix-turn-helix domain-containing protein [Burkholderiales bacterium]